MKNKLEQPFSIKKRIISFGYAFNGLIVLFKEEHNARIHLFACVLVVIVGLTLQISANEWLAISLSVGMVISLEAINSAIETLADVVLLAPHDGIKKVKDLSAAAVLIGAFAALAVGIIIFAPKLWLLI